jgi:PAS domain S-box-containing protein
MMKRIWILSLLPIFVGLLAVSGWWAHIISFVTLDTKVPMVFNCAVGFVLAGLALLFATNPSKFAKETQIALGLLICLVAAGTLSEDLFNLNFHLDELCVKCWAPSVYLSPHLGRMSMSMSSSFLMIGLTLIFLRFAYIKFLAMCSEVFIFLSFLIGVLGLFGDALNIDYMTGWYNYTRMPLSSSICLISISLALSLIWRNNPDAKKLYENAQDLKIVMISSAVLLCVSLTVGLASVSRDIQLIVPVTVATILIGIVMLRWTVRPLIRRMLSAEKELRQTNKRLYESEERYSLAFKGNQSGVWDWNVGSKFIYSSPYTKALLGYAEHEMPNTVDFYHQITHPDDLEKIVNLIDLHLKKNVPFKIEYRLKTKSTGYRFFEIIGQAIQNDEGVPVRMVGSLRDVTENRKVEKLKNEFVSLVRNELNAPVKSIQESLDIIVNNSEDQLSPSVLRLLKRAKQNCERLSFLMTEILDIAKIESGKTKFKFKIEDIMQIVKAAIIERQAYAERNGVHLRLAQAADNVKVNVDSELLLQVLANLISNAVKFSPEGGEVTIAVARRDNFVRVAVTDQGPGIPEKFQTQIFQEYVPSESAPVREGEGVLLGLKLSKAIIEEFGGAMSFLTTPKHGTTFYFDLPQARENTIPGNNLQVGSH